LESILTKRREKSCCCGGGLQSHKSQSFYSINQIHNTPPPLNLSMRQWRMYSCGWWWGLLFQLGTWYIFTFCGEWLFPTNWIHPWEGGSHLTSVSTRTVLVSAFSFPDPSLPSTISRCSDEEDVASTDIVICGGGPTGLLCAIMLSEKFPQVRSGLCFLFLPSSWKCV
jgi:hypothetical protein